MTKRLWKLLLAWRLWLLIPLLLASWWLAYRTGSEFTQLWHHTQPYPVAQSEVIFPWANFDGVHYLAIASRGYIDEGRFLPLFPLLIRWVAAPLNLIFGDMAYGPTYFWTGLILSQLFFVGALYFLQKLLRLDFDQKTTNLALWLLVLFPTSFFLVSIYTESLFLLLTILSFYFAKKRHWRWSILVATLLAVTRLSGVLIILPLAWEWWRQEKKFSLKMLSLAVIPTLLIGYSYFNYLKWGDWLYFVHAHGALGNSRATSGLVFPLVTLWRYFKIFISLSPQLYEFWVAVVEALSLAIATLGLIWAYLKKVDWPQLLFAILIITLPILSGTLSGLPRYILPAYPLFIGLASVLAKKPKIRTTWLIFSFIIQAIFLILFARGYFIA